MRLGIYGGSFNPIHYGHLLLAESCREQCSLDQVVFVPAATPPHKLGVQLASADQRVAMLKLAIGGHDCFSLNELELRRGGVSYTVDTLEQFRSDSPDIELFFLMGADSLADLATWKDPARICEISVPVIVQRTGSPAPKADTLAPLVAPGRLEELRRFAVEMPLIDLSSSDIRRRVAAGRSIRYQVPPAVEAFISAERLYATENAASK